MASPVLQFKRGLLANLPGLQAGEPAFTTDSFDLFVGLTSETNTNKFFGSHRYWTKETTSTGSGINLVEGTSNGSEYITIKSPDSLAGIVTYTLPGVQGATSSVLTNDGSGNLTWSSGSANPVFTGIATFSDTTDNTLGDVDTGAVQIDGGVGIAKNVTVGAGLSVTGDSYFIGTATFYGGQINLGDSDTDDIVVAGEFKSNLIPSDDATYNLGSGDKRWNNASFAGVATITSLDVQTDFDIYAPTSTFHNSVIVEGNLTVNGTETIINTTTLTVQDKEIILGVGTNGSPSDASASGGGVSIASTEGAPLADFYIAGIHTHPNTYKDIVWIRADDLGVGTTDAWHFNYAVGIGSTQVPNGVRFAVTNTQITDDTLSTPQINVSGASTVGGLLDVNGGIDVTGHSELDDLNVTGVSTFTGLVDANGGLDVSGQTTLNNDLVVTGLVDANGGLDVTGQVVFNNDLEVTGVSTFTGLVDANGGLDVSGQTTLNNDLSVTGVSTFTGVINANGGLDVTGSIEIDDLNVTGVSTFAGAINANDGLFVDSLTEGRVVLAGASGALEDSIYLTFGADGLTVGSGGIDVTDGIYVTGISTFSSDLVVGNNIKVDGGNIQAIDGNTNITLTSNTLTTFAGDIKVSGNDIQASDGNTNITLTSNTLTTFAGDIRVSGNSIESSTATALTLSGADVKVEGDLTVGGSDIKAADGTTALTLVDSTGAVTTASDLTVGGNLYVSGNTTQVNTASLTVEDRTIELGIVDGSAPSSTTTWDLGVLFNYFQTSAKKSAVVWEQADARFKFGSEVSDGGGTDANSPQITFTAFAPIEVGSLWVTDCAGTSQVISCTGTERFLENITIDAGTF